MIEMSRRLLDCLDLEAAVQGEVEWIPDLIPKPIADRASEDHVAEIASYFSSLAQSGEPITASPTIAARKWRHGRRVVPLIPLYERVLYRAVMNFLSPDLVAVVRGNEAYEEFRRAPLEDTSVKYVVMTDIASYYDLIDIDKISRVLLHRTGRFAAVEWLRGFWVDLAGGRGGIPQMTPASDLAGDTYADVLHRNLLRRGLSVYRYADDYRIGATSWSECIQALETFDEEARSLGLIANERKTLTPSREKYEELITASDRRTQELSNLAHANLVDFDSYTLEAIQPEEADLLHETAVQLLLWWRSEGNRDEADEKNAYGEIGRVLTQALLVMSSVLDPLACEFVPLIARYEPQLMPYVARYLDDVAPAYPDQATEALLLCISDAALTPWQHLWLLWTASNSAISQSGTANGKTLRSWMCHHAANSRLPLRCQAIWSLARQGNLRLDLWESIDSLGSRYASPYLAASSEGINDLSKKKREQLRAVNVLDRRVCEWANDGYIQPF